MIFEKIYNILLLINLFIIIINYKVLGKHNIQSLTYDHPYQFEDITDLRSSIAEINPKNSIRNDIRRAFEPMRVKEELLDYMVELMCKRISEDPVYTFKMPLSQYKYKNLIMHRSDFEIPVYPNLTETHIQMAKLSKRVDLNVMPKPLSDNSGWLQKYTPNIINKNFNNYNENDDDGITPNSDDELLQNEIVKTNTVTETNFINYVLKTNDKGEKYLKKEKSNNNLKNSNHNYYTTFKTTKQPTGKYYQNHFGEPKIKYMKNYLSDPKIDWSEFGVNIEEYYEPNKYSSTYNQNPEADLYEPKNFQHSNYDIQMPGDYGFFDKTEKNSVWDLPGKLSSIPLRLEDKYLMNTNDILRNMTILLTKESRPRWPLTAKKDSHKDLDIYIARSNDPFGHSTKWQIRNQTNSITAIDLKKKTYRKKRGIKELYSMIKCSTGCDPLIYKGYGCFCGFMGSGIPVDGIDRCCKMHDDCYTQSNCPSYLEYFIPFLWKCYRGKPLCASSHGEWGGPRSCAAQLCQCDLNLAKCLRKFQCPRKRAVCKSSYVRMIQNYLMVY